MLNILAGGPECSVLQYSAPSEKALAYYTLKVRFLSTTNFSFYFVQKMQKL